MVFLDVRFIWSGGGKGCGIQLGSGEGIAASLVLPCHSDVQLLCQAAEQLHGVKSLTKETKTVVSGGVGGLVQVALP
jgi:hypothetical protein